MIPTPRPLFGLLAFAATLSPLSAQSIEPVAFPLVVEDAFETEGLAYTLEPELLGALEAQGDSATIQGAFLPRPGGVDMVDLLLQREDVVTDDFQLLLDGELWKDAVAARADQSLWSGTVVGEPGSSVYLAFGRTTVTGWIARDHGIAHLFSVHDEDEGWEAGRAAIVHDSDPALQDPRPGFTCQTLLPPGQLPPTPSSHGGGGTEGAGSMIEVLVSVETDHQFYQLFSNETVAADYALALWGAINVLYTAEASTHVRLPYLAIYSNANDPWTEPDVGNAGTVLDEFRNAWAGNIPNGGDLGHFISGANLGGGVAYLDVLCNPSFAFAVSGNLGGQTPFPVQTTNALNWDFYVTAHELGHNYGSPHTHDFCPTPLDECSPSLGSCQTQTVCTVGTIMSYCHLCPGGVGNVAMNFHPTVSALLTSEAAGASCLGSCTDCDQPPLVDFDVSPATGPAPLFTTFSSTVYGDVTAYDWDFGDGNGSTLSSTGHVYLFPGSYDVTLTVTWSGGEVEVLKVGAVQVDGGSNASATERNGSGTNPSIFTSTTLPILGTNWVSSVDGTSVGGSGLSFVFGFGRALTGLPTAFGELLIDPTAQLFLSNVSFFIGGVATHTEIVPNDTSLIGTPVYTQAFLNGQGIPTNAIDLILGL